MKTVQKKKQKKTLFLWDSELSNVVKGVSKSYLYKNLEYNLW